MSALRCSICGHSWPVLDEFKKCAECLEKTDIINNIQPTMTLEEAMSMKAHFDFERFYDERGDLVGDEATEAEYEADDASQPA